jgi:hypothetical protein
MTLPTVLMTVGGKRREKVSLYYDSKSISLFNLEGFMIVWIRCPTTVVELPFTYVMKNKSGISPRP